MIRTDETLVATSFAPNQLQRTMRADIVECANLVVLPTDDNNGCGYALYIACYPVANIRHLGIKGYVQPDAAENFHFLLEPLSRELGVDRPEVGTASCRGSVGSDVEISVVAGQTKK